MPVNANPPGSVPNQLEKEAISIPVETCIGIDPAIGRRYPGPWMTPRNFYYPLQAAASRDFRGDVKQ